MVPGSQRKETSVDGGVVAVALAQVVDFDHGRERGGSAPPRQSPAGLGGQTKVGRCDRPWSGGRRVRAAPRLARMASAAAQPGTEQAPRVSCRPAGGRATAGAARGATGSSTSRLRPLALRRSAPRCYSNEVRQRRPAGVAPGRRPRLRARGLRGAVGAPALAGRRRGGDLRPWRRSPASRRRPG